MAKKKVTTKASPKATKRAAKKAAPKGATAQTATKSGTPKAKATKKAATAGAAKKKAAKKAPAVKLTDKQRDLLSKVQGGSGAFTASGAAEQRALDTLQQKKLIKKGAKDKATGKVPFSVTKAGEKALTSAAASASSSTSTS
jgi:hypothetical protein